MTKANLQHLSKSAKVENAGAPPVKVHAKVKIAQAVAAPAKMTKARQIRKESEANVSEYFPAEVKACLRMVQTKNGKNVMECWAEAPFMKHDVPMPISLKINGDQ